MDSSQFMIKAKKSLSRVRGKSLTVEERIEEAVALASLMLTEARRRETSKEKRIQQQLTGMVEDDQGKWFITSLTDECFRSQKSARVVDQILYLMEKHGIPRFLSRGKKFQLKVFKFLGKLLPGLFAPLAKRMVRKEAETVIMPGEPDPLAKHMQKRRQEGVRINLNRLGEAILGEEEAERRLRLYLSDLADPAVEYISVKISTLYSQINLLAWEKTLDVLTNRLKLLLRAAQKHRYVRQDGTEIPKFVNLDMEEYRDLHLTVDLFKRVLDNAEFFRHSAGIVLQSYIPDSFLVQQELTTWAMCRVASGGAPIKIRIVKGANLAMEKVEASLRGWSQAPYTDKEEVDANFKRMLLYGCEPEHARASHLGIGSHNLFDIAYAMLLCSEHKLEPYVGFEMLEGMADNMRRVVQALAGDMLLYCPAAMQDQFQNAVAYLIRRLDENTGPENFLRYLFKMEPESPEWKDQAQRFTESCRAVKSVDYHPRRQQNRFVESKNEVHSERFANEADTDWTLLQNRKWIETLLQEWSHKVPLTIPLVIGGKEISSSEKWGSGSDPSCPKKQFYQYVLADSRQAEEALRTATQAQEQWSNVPVRERFRLLGEIAIGLRQMRGELIGAMAADTGKTVTEADTEVSEAIDFAEYYRRSLEELDLMEDIRWSPKGTVLVAPPWNFPCSIPSSGVLASLAAGNCVILKPAPEAVLVGWTLVNIFWRAGIPKEVLQFFTCEDDPVGSQLIKDPRVNAVLLTGATSTAKAFLKMSPDVDLMAETGGKNAMIITGLADKELAIKDVVQSAFGYSGQKCSACSLLICESEVYDDPHFRSQLRDAAASLSVGSPWNMDTRIVPLIRPPSPALLRGLTTLEEGEEWLLQPRQDSQNPNLWSPGIKLGVRPGSFTHQTELFGPVLGVMRAKDLNHAISLANGTPYGLTAGLHSLDEREQQHWIENVMAGNCYINRGMTGAIVRRQPFGGCKESSFGPGAKAGGPNYVLQLMQAKQVQPPSQRDPVKELTDLAAFDGEQMQDWKAGVESYHYFWNFYFSKKHDPSQVLGQENILKYVPHEGMVLRLQNEDTLLDATKAVAAAQIGRISLEISIDPNNEIKIPLRNLSYIKETEDQLVKRIQMGEIKRMRLLSPPSKAIKAALADAGGTAIAAPVLSNGRLELLHYLREVSLSRDYHRYGAY